MPVQTQRQPDNRSRRMVSTPLRPLYPEKDPNIHYTGSWVCLGSGRQESVNVCTSSINTCYGSSYEFQVRQFGEKGFFTIHSSLNRCLISDEICNRIFVNWHSTHSTAKNTQNHWSHPSTCQDTNPTEHTLLTIMYEYTMMQMLAAG
jgi:hypothetical protein